MYRISFVLGYSWWKVLLIYASQSLTFHSFEDLKKKIRGICTNDLCLQDAHERFKLSGLIFIRTLPKSFEVKDPAEPTPVLRMRGLPFSAGKDDIIDFFKDFTLSEESIHITYNFEGRPTGEAFVVFAGADEAKAALAKDRMTLGSRYIELFQSSPEELNESASRGR